MMVMPSGRRSSDPGLGLEIVGDGDRPELALMVDAERRGRFSEPRYRRQRHLIGGDAGHYPGRGVGRLRAGDRARALGVAGKAATRLDIDAAQIGRVALKLPVDLENEPVLIALGVDGRDLPLR